MWAKLKTQLPAIGLSVTVTGLVLGGGGWYLYRTVILPELQGQRSELDALRAQNVGLPLSPEDASRAAAVADRWVLPAMQLAQITQAMAPFAIVNKPPPTAPRGAVPATVRLTSAVLTPADSTAGQGDDLPPPVQPLVAGVIRGQPEGRRGLARMGLPLVPPAPRSEVTPAATVPGMMWVPGYWALEDGDVFAWMAGHWERPPFGMAHYQGARWEQRGGTYVFIPGRWTR